MELFADWETRSELEIKEVGLNRYVEHPSTFPLMLAYGPRNHPKQWILDLSAFSARTIPACPEDLLKLIEDSRVEFHAHNAAFEIAVWSKICCERWGWPVVPLERWFCTAAKGSAANQPRNLAELVKRLGLGKEYQKDERGKELIKLLSVPQKAVKTYLRTAKDKDGKSIKDPTDPKGKRVVKEVVKDSVQYLQENGIELFPGPCEGALYFYRNDLDLMREFQAYNVQDIVAEAAADAKLPDLSPLEREVWLLDQRINSRGIPVDVDLCRGALAVYHREVEVAEADLVRLTEGQVTRCTQREKLVKWINERVNFGSCLDAESVDGFLESYEDPQTWEGAGAHGDYTVAVPQVLEALEIRKRAGGTAVAKYQAALDQVSPDGRCRHQLLYYGAATGRWTGKGIQPHNFKREATPDETFIDALKTGDYDTVRFLCDLEGITVFKILKKALRGIICAPPGRKMIVSDFAGIESRVLHWLVGNGKKLEQFRKREDTYIHAAVDIYKLPFHELAEWSDKEGKFVIRKEHKEKRQIGKACELGLGYGMGSATFQANAAKAKSFLSAEFSAEVVAKWRESNPQVPDFWYRIERACKDRIWNRNRCRRKATVEKVKVYIDPRNYLCIELPSGRILYYFDPVVREGKIYYRDGGKAGSWENDGRIDTYGGKLTENIVQAIARDLLVFSLMLIERAGLSVIFHVHDESVTEVDEHDEQAEGIVHAAMTSLPTWAAGLPLEAETHAVRRYTK